MKRVLSAMIAMWIPCWVAAEVPDVNDFRIVPQFPDPAAGASLVLGTNAFTGQLALWDGDQVYLQEILIEVEPTLEAIASGYIGDPSFFDIKLDNVTAVFGSGPDGIVYQMNLFTPSDFETGNRILVPTHASGVLLTGTLLLLDRMNDGGTRAELIVVDLATVRGVAADAQLVIEKPAGSGTASVFVNAALTLLYTMDSMTRELRTFPISTIVTAFNEDETLDWEADGTLIGTAGQFLNGGVAAINRAGELILGGSTGAPNSGGIQFVNPTEPASILATLDPAGSGPPFVVLFNSVLDEVIAIDPTFAPPFVYATEDAIPPIPPESPCLTEEEIDTAFELFRATIAGFSDDIDGDGIPETAFFELIELISCRNIEEDPLALSANSAFDINLDVFGTELSFAVLSEFNEVIAMLMLMSQATQDALIALLADNGTPIFGSYTILTCTALDNCFPEFVEDPDPDLRGQRTHLDPLTEPYSAEGDPDDDGLTNLTEYNNVVAMGGDDFDFAIAASSDQLDGGDGITGGSSGGGCFIATAAYGTPLAGEIDVLRHMRDRSLLPTALGAAFVDTYYRLSPGLAERIAQDPALRAGVRTFLQPAIWAARPHRTETVWLVALLVCVMVVARAGFYRRRPGKDG